MNFDFESYPHQQTFKFKLVDREIHHAFLLQDHINFKFTFKIKYFNWVAKPYSTSAEFAGEEGPYTFRKSVHVPVMKSSLSYQETQEAIDEVLITLPLKPARRRQLIRYAWKKYYETLWSSKHKHIQSSDNAKTVTTFDFQVTASVQTYVEIEPRTTECSICLDDLLEDSEEATELPCNHFFHRDCIKKWLKAAANCPLCRFELPEEELERFDE